MKQIVAKVLASRVVDGDVIGLGSGTTVLAAIEEIGRRIKSEGISVSGISTSIQTAHAADQAGISVLSDAIQRRLRWAFDGADEVDAQLNLLKGAGGAFFQEKIIAKRSDKLVILVTPEKMVTRLGEKFAVPVEVEKKALSYVEAELKKLGASEVTLRTTTNSFGKQMPAVSDQGNLILDAKFFPATAELENKINCITGVIENGIFSGCTSEVLLARDGAVFSLTLEGGKIQERPASGT